MTDRISDLKHKLDQWNYNLFDETASEMREWILNNKVSFEDAEAISSKMSENFFTKAVLDSIINDEDFWEDNEQ